MVETTAAVRTFDAERLILCLCKRWQDRMEIDFRRGQGVIHFEDAVATLTPQSDRLIVTIIANDEPGMERVQNMVRGHLENARTGEEALRFDWRRSPDCGLCAL